MAIARNYSINPSLNRRKTTISQIKYKSLGRREEVVPAASYTRVCVEDCPGCTKQKIQLNKLPSEEVFIVTHLLEDLLRVYKDVCICLGGRDMRIVNAQFSNMCNPSNHARLIRDIIKRIEARK